MRESIEKLREVTITTILNDGDLTSLLLRTYGTLWQCVPSVCIKSLTLYHSKIINQGFKKLELMEKNQEYILKKGIRIYDHKNAMHYTSFNMTDKIAKKLLKANPTLAAKFEKLPTEPTKMSYEEAVKVSEKAEKAFDKASKGKAKKKAKKETK